MASKKIETFDEFKQAIVKNIVADRKVAHSLLSDIQQYLQNTPDTDSHAKVGMVATKYLETLQRSNEQLVKLTAIIAKKESQKDPDAFDPESGFSENETDNMFDEIQNEEG